MHLDDLYSPRVCPHTWVIWNWNYIHTCVQGHELECTEARRGYQMSCSITLRWDLSLNLEFTILDGLAGLALLLCAGILSRCGHAWLFTWVL